ncbi:septum formation family protein, partial [Streptomyces sp. PSRA5]
GASSCPCPKTLHHDHDAAVRAHSAALDLEVENTALSSGQRLDEATQHWSNAARLWGQVLRRAVFWDHVRHRISVLDDRQLDESVIDTLRDALPTTLVRPLIELAAAASTPADRARLAVRARDWPLVPSNLVDDQLEEAAAPHYESLRATAKRASSQLEGGNWDGAAAEAYDHALPALARLEALVPYARHRRTASARNDVAVLLNNCATAAADALGPAANLNASKWFRTAAELATDPVTQQTIKTNRDGLAEMMATFTQIKAQVDQLLDAGHVHLARTLLLRVKTQLAGGPGSDEIDRMLADLRVRPGTYTPRRIGGGARARALALAWAVLLALGILFAAWTAGSFDGDGDAGSGSGPQSLRGVAVVSAAEITDNSPVGSCIEQESDWTPGAREVDVVPCDEPHWGEVVAYVPLVDTASRYLTAEYPGIDQAVALSRFRCERALAEFRPDDTRVTVKYSTPGEDAWNPSGPTLDEYATCVAHRRDNQNMTAADRVGVDAPAIPTFVPMPTFAANIAVNAPVGSCVESKTDLATVTADLPIVPCGEAHWAEIVGYPVLYADDAGEWPGDKAVFDRARAACEDRTKGLSSELRLHVTYPAQDWWTSADRPIYAMCAVSYLADNIFTGGLR